ncbi:hypothetical protein ABZ943_18510 [Streptomyces rubiginosohelvolus]
MAASKTCPPENGKARLLAQLHGWWKASAILPSGVAATDVALAAVDVAGT